MTEKIKVCHRKELELDTRKVISAKSGNEIGVFSDDGKLEYRPQDPSSFF